MPQLVALSAVTRSHLCDTPLLVDLSAVTYPYLCDTPLLVALSAVTCPYLCDTPLLVALSAVTRVNLEDVLCGVVVKASLITPYLAARHQHPVLEREDSKVVVTTWLQ